MERSDYTAGRTPGQAEGERTAQGSDEQPMHPTPGQAEGERQVEPGRRPDEETRR